MKSRVKIKSILYQIWKRIGYTKWNYKLFRLWSCIGIKMGYSEQVIEEEGLKYEN
jgi:hypothetical protein